MKSMGCQVKRAAASIPANIAEGCSRETDKDFRKFLRTALGSGFELETHLIIAERLRFIESNDVKVFFDALHLELKQVNTLISRTKGK